MENPMHIPLIKPDVPSLDDIRMQFAGILDSGRVTNFGKYVQQFECEACRYLGTQVVALSSGTAGLIFALNALDLQRDERVVLPSFTFVATAQAAIYAGGTPLFADIDDDL